MRQAFFKHAPLIALGLASFGTYLYARSLTPLRAHVPAFILAFGLAFLFYAIATMWVLHHSDRSTLWVIFGLAASSYAVLVFSQPSLSDDMYRYVWDGRVQAAGINSYRYAPQADEVRYLRDREIWPKINRKSAVTVYPPLAEGIFALLWRIRPDDVRWFQLATSGASLLAGGLLIGLLRDLGRSPERVLIYLWSPLLIFETAHSAHVDGFILPLIVSAFWARTRERDGWTGVWLGLAAAIKLYPALLFPALWRPDHRSGRWRMPLAFFGVLAASYLPDLVSSGVNVLGFLPNYLEERFNLSPIVYWLLRNLPHETWAQSQRSLQIITLSLLGLAGLAIVIRPARDSMSALRRCLWLIGIYILLNPNLFSWYLLWLLPLVAIFLEPGRLQRGGKVLLSGVRLDAWTGWWLFCGLTALSYTFFIAWKPVPAAIALQFWPLYAFLAVDVLRRLRPAEPGLYA
jgi:alpha-1,6-mannosyltransferase